MTEPTPFFRSAERIAALRAEAERWSDYADRTPFAPAGAVRGRRGGACCHRLVIGVLAGAGLPITQGEVPDAPLNRAAHHQGSVMADWLRGRPGRFDEIPLPTPECVRPGDILLIQHGIGVHHAALALDRGEILQTLQGHGAHITQPVERRYRHRLWGCFRPLES